MNEEERRFITIEKGAGVKEWKHTMTILPKGNGAIQVDQIRIDAGLLTPIIAMMAKRM